jgi:hypothetical protein
MLLQGLAMDFTFGKSLTDFPVYVSLSCSLIQYVIEINVTGTFARTCTNPFGRTWPLSTVGGFPVAP